MSEERFPDEMLMRFADGELDADEMTVIEKAMETDDDLVARVAMFIETKAEAKAALKPLLDEPMPDRLKAAVEEMIEAARAEEKGAEATPATVVPFEARRTAAPPPSARQWMLPLAASIAAVVGGLAGYWAAGQDDPVQNGLAVAGVASPALAAALETVPAGEEIALATGGRFRAIATFRDAEDLCREFEFDAADRSTVVSVACSSGGVWRVSFAVAAAGDAGGYAPASSTEALDAYLSAIEAGDPLSTEEEARALAELRR